MTPEYAWTHREGRRARYEGHRVGGTVVVHFIKKNMWYLETALAMLEGEEESEVERYEAGRRTLSSSLDPSSQTDDADAETLRMEKRKSLLDNNPIRVQ